MLSKGKVWLADSSKEDDLLALKMAAGVSRAECGSQASHSPHRPSPTTEIYFYHPQEQPVWTWETYFLILILWDRSGQRPE